RSARAVDHEADADRGAGELAHHDADHAAADGEPQAGEQERCRARHDDAAEEKRLRRREAARYGQKPRIGGAHRRVRVDEQRQHGEQEDDEDARRKPGADPQHDERQQRDLRGGVQGGDERCDGMRDEPVAAAHQAERHADEEREAEAERQLEPARREVRPDPSGRDEQRPGSGRDRARRGDEDRLEPQRLGGAAEQGREQVGPPAAAEPFPHDQHREQRRQPKDRALVREIEADDRMRARHRVAAGCGRQRSKRCSTRSSRPVVTRPVAVNRRTPKNSVSVWNVLPASAIMWPSPAVEAYSSPTTTPSRARPAAYLRPVKMNGTVPGRTMLEKILRCEAPKLHATRRKRASLARTPACVAMMIGMIAPRNTTANFDHRPMPNHTTMIGRKVTRGTALSESMNGPSRYCARRYQPTIRPSGMASAMAAR